MERRWCVLIPSQPLLSPHGEQDRVFNFLWFGDRGECACASIAAPNGRICTPLNDDTLYRVLLDRQALWRD